MGAFLRAGRTTFRADRLAAFVFTTLRAGFLAGFLDPLLAAFLATFFPRRAVAFFADAFFFAAFAAAFFAGFLATAFLAGFAPAPRFPAAGLAGFRVAAFRFTAVSGLAGSGADVDIASLSRSGRDTGGGGGVGGAGGGDDGIGSIHPDPDQPISMSWNAAIGYSLQRVLGVERARTPGARKRRLISCTTSQSLQAMKALVLTELGGIDRLALADLPDPGPPGPGQVRIGVRAAALNRLDLFVLGGLPGVNLNFPHPVATDAAGVVEAVGEGVPDLAPGDRAVVNPGISCGTCPACLGDQDPLCRRFGILGEHLPGTAAEHLLVPARNVIRLTADFTWAEAAALPLATLTAWRMLTTRARVAPGETVLIWGIGGGVALAALQVAKHLGASVIVTSSSDAKLERARALGANLALNHATDDVVREVKSFTGFGAHVVVDSVGEKTWERSLKALRPGGRLVTCGATTGPHVSIDIRRLFWFQWSLLGSTMASVSEVAAMMAVANTGRLRPVVDSIHSLAQGRDAYSRLASGEHFGKVVLEVPG